MIIENFSKNYAFLSNSYPSQISPWEDGLIYPTAEHAYQAIKTFNPEERKSIAAASNTWLVKKIGKQIQLRSDWEDIKIFAMKDILKDKFKNPKMREKLIATEDAELINGNNWHDNFWGNCTCSQCINIQGENNLGRLLMEIRNEYRKN